MSRKIPKPPKGGKTQHHQRVSQQGVPRITADMMIADKGLYRDMMYSPYRVKTPEGMEVNEKFLEQIDVLKSFADIKIESNVLKLYDSVYGGHETYEECMQVSHDSNTMILLEALSMAIQFSDMDDPYDRGWVNILKIIVSLYNGNPYMRDRVGHLMWCVAKHISPSCYFPLSLDLYYDPRLWHRPGQNPRPPLKIPDTLAFDGSGQEFGPEDDIWSCELPDSR